MAEFLHRCTGQREWVQILPSALEELRSALRDGPLGVTDLDIQASHLVAVPSDPLPVTENGPDSLRVAQCGVLIAPIGGHQLLGLGTLRLDEPDLPLQLGRVLREAFSLGHR